MFELFGLIFMLMKIAVLAMVYATITAFFVFIILKFYKNKWILVKGFGLWWLLGVIYSIVLFIYAFSYWGDHGLGDNDYIPIWNGYKVSEIDGSEAYFEYSKEHPSDQAAIGKLAIRNNILCSELQNLGHGACINCFFTFDTKVEKMNVFHSKEEYDAYAMKNNLPLRSQFKDFNEIDHDYWGGYRFWLLP